MKQVILLSCVLLLPFAVANCSNQNTPAATYSRQAGEKCSEIDNCKEGLLCEDGICRILCKNNSDCNKGQHCEVDRCVNDQGHQSNTDVDHTDVDHTDIDHTDIDNTDQDTDNPGPGPGDNTDIDNTDQDTDNPGPGPGDNTDSVLAFPSGGGLTNVGGEASGSRYKVRVLDGSVSGAVSGSQNKVQIGEGSWK